MLKKHILIPFYALLMGVAGSLFYRQLLTEAEVLNSLPIPGSPSAIAVTIACGIALVLFLLVSFKSKGLQGGALYTAPSKVRALLLLGSAAAILFSSMLHLKTVMDVYATGVSLLSCFLELILVVLSVPTVVSAAFLAKDAKEGAGRSHGSLTVLFPVLYGWFWLIDVFRRHSPNPILWEYLFLMMAAVFLLLAAFGCAGFSFGDGKPRFTVFSCLCALFLAPISLVSYFDLPTLFTTVGLTLYTIATLTALLRNLPMPDFPAPEEESEPELETEVSDDE